MISSNRNSLIIISKKVKHRCICSSVQMMSQNLRGEMSADLAGAKLNLSDSRFIQVIAKSLSISCKEVSGTSSLTIIKELQSLYIQTSSSFSKNLWCLQELEAIRDALTPPLACAAAKIGDVEALEALKEMVNSPLVSSARSVCQIVC